MSSRSVTGAAAAMSESKPPSTKSAVDGGRSGVCLQNLSDLSGRELVGLNRIGQTDQAYGSIGLQAGGDEAGGVAASVVAVQPQNYPAETFQQRPLLRVVQRRAHQSHYGPPRRPGEA